MILGNVYRERGQVSRAIQVHQALLQRPKLTRLEHSYVLLCLGLDYKRGGFVDRALEAFKEVLRLSPDNQYALLYLEKLYEEQHQWDEAYRIRRQLVELSGPDTQPRNQAILGFLENALGIDALKAQHRDEAARHFESAIGLDSPTTPAYLNLGDVRLQAGDAAGAVAAWQQLMEVAPERAHLALERLERALHQQGAPQRFEEQCRRFIEGGRRTGGRGWPWARHLSRAGEPPRPSICSIEALEQNPHGLTVHQAVWTVLLQLDLDRALVQRTSRPRAAPCSSSTPTSA